MPSPVVTGQQNPPPGRHKTGPYDSRRSTPPPRSKFSIFNFQFSVFNFQFSTSPVDHLSTGSLDSRQILRLENPLSNSHAASGSTTEEVIKGLGLKVGAKVVGIAAASAFNEYVPVGTPPGGLSARRQERGRYRGHRTHSRGVALSRPPSDGDHRIRFPGECGGACHGRLHRGRTRLLRRAGTLSCHCRPHPSHEHDAGGRTGQVWELEVWQPTSFCIPSTECCTTPPS